MDRLNCYKLLVCCCLVVVLNGCQDGDDYRGQILSGRWFGDLGMMVDGNRAVGSDLEFIPHEYGGYSEGYGYETDYYRRRGRLEIVEHSFMWKVMNGVIYLRFDNPELDCNISDYSLSPDYFRGYMDGVYSSTRFTLRNYDRYWNDYGYWDDYYDYYRSVPRRAADNSEVGMENPVCIMMINTPYGIERNN